MFCFCWSFQVGRGCAAARVSGAGLKLLLAFSRAWRRWQPALLRKAQAVSSSDAAALHIRSDSEKPLGSSRKQPCSKAEAALLLSEELLLLPELRWRDSASSSAPGFLAGPLRLLAGCAIAAAFTQADVCTDCPAALEQH